MKLRSWLSTCSSTASVDAAAPPPKSLPSDVSSTSSDFQTNSSTSSLQSNLSLLTLPSVPSLQKLPLSPQTSASATATAVLFTHHRRASHIHSLAVHGNLLYAASGNEIHVFDTTSAALLDTFNSHKPHSGAVKSIAFQNGKIFTAHQDRKIRVWTIHNNRKGKQQHKLLSTLPTLEDRLARLVLPKNYVNVRRHKKSLWIQHHDAVSGVAAATCHNNHEKLVVSVSWDRSIKIWHARDYTCRESITRAHDDAINAIAVSEDGLVYTGSADKRIKAWKREGDDNKYGLLATLEKHKSAVNALSLDKSGSVLFSGSCDRSILVWEKEDSANYMVVAGALRGHGRAILCLFNVRDLLLSGSADRTVRIWRRGFDGRFCCLTVLDGHRTPVRSVAAAAVAEAEEGGGGVKVFSGSFDGEIRVWQVEVSSEE